MNIRQQIEAAYRVMARAGYRPAAPSDGFGNITADKLDLRQEIKDYTAAYWAEEEGSGSYFLGYPDYENRPAFILAIEAARLLCAGFGGEAAARELLKAAVKQIDASPTPRGKVV